MVPRISVSSRRIRIDELTPDAFAPFGEVIQNPSVHDGQPRGLENVQANQGSATKWVDVTQMKSFYDMSPSGKPASVKMNMFVCKPRQLETASGKDLFRVKILERHPFTPQTFIPMGLDSQDLETAYLVIVAPTKSVGAAGLPSNGLSGLTCVPSRRRSLRQRLFGTVGQSSLINEGGARRAGPDLPDTDNLQAFIARGDQAVTYGAGTWHAPMVVLGKTPIEFVVVQFMSGVAEEDVQEVQFEDVSWRDSQIEVEIDPTLLRGQIQAKL